MAYSRDKSPETTFGLEKYYLLQTQQEDLRRRLSTTSTTSSVTPASTQSVASSPTKTSSFSSRRPGSFSNATSKHAQDVDDEDKLCNVNRQIKATLTELLNCESVKHDDSFRLWVQSRLMHAEHELKNQRRRRSSVAVEDVEAVREHLQHTLSET